MAIGLNPTLDRFVNWANQDGIGKTDLVHATKAQGTTGGEKVVLAGNTGDGIGFFASRRRSADTRDLNNATREPGRDPANSPLTLSFGDDGSLRVHYVSLHDKPQIRHEGANFTRLFTEFDKGSSVTFTADVEINAEELEKIAAADYTQFDDAASEAAMNGRMDTDEAGAAAMGQFRFGDGVKVSVSCTTVLKGGELMLEEVF